MIYERTRALLPGGLRRYVLFFESAIEDAVGRFAASLPSGARLLDAGAGEGNYKHHFARQRYVGLDLGVGDTQWDYSKLDLLGDLSRLPFRDGAFDAALNVVTLEHVREPAQVIRELARTLAPGGTLLLIAPHEWEEHQQPHDYYRYTRYGLDHLLKTAGFIEREIKPVGGFFRVDVAETNECASILPGPADGPGRSLLRASRSSPAAVRASGPASKFYTGLHMLGSKVVLIEP